MINSEPNSLTIRVATTADASAITDVINQAFRSAENFFVKGDRLDQTEVDRLLSTGTFLLAADKGVMLGCVYVEPESAVQPIRAYLGLLSVDPDQQRGGIGSQLMDAAEDHCRKLGCAFN
ncbi:MAG TPA: GNAT family N-acetyltransferase [Pyrinomonadaceae bacterium]|nr:GNAT family N-acetyltransferase [Pyrinomonadaceae bacterium]